MIPASPTNSRFQPLERLPQNSDGAGEFDANFSWSKTIFPNLAVSVGAGPTWLHYPSGYGWDALDTEAKYQFFCIPQLEFMGSVGFDVSWGGSATGGAGWFAQPVFASA
jgi:hypothetical protein